MSTTAKIKFLSFISKCFPQDKNPFLPEVPCKTIKQKNSQNYFNKLQDTKRKFVRNQRTKSK